MAEKVIVAPHWQIMLEIYPPELVGNLPSRMLEKAVCGGVVLEVLGHKTA